MREIKFRGRNIDTGEFVFGDLCIIDIRPHFFKEAQCYYDEELIEVEPETVVQLVGYDKNGKEVYEGDKLIDRDGRRIKAALRPNFTSIAVLDKAND